MHTATPHELVSTRYRGVELVGTVSTYYTDRDDPRFELALQNAEYWRDAGLPFVVVDGSPMESEGDTWVADAHRERGAVVVRSQINGIASQRQQGVNFAIKNGAERVVGHEPEKPLMATFKREIVDGLNQHDILVIGRTALAEASLPPAQRRTERLAGWILEQTHHFPADALSGGRGFTATGAEYLTRYPATEPGMNNWIYLYHTPLAARAAGLSIGGIKVDLIHPEAMVKQETGNSTFDRKRYDQFKLQLDYMLKRDDLTLEGIEIADLVLGRLQDYKEQDSNEKFEAQLSFLESALRSRGYKPASSVL